jgi:hypothetical protein
VTVQAVSTIVFVLAWGLAMGAGGRWFVPGPDPMPAWLTTSIGVAGSLVGGGIVVAVTGLPDTAGEAYGLMWAAIAASLVGSALLVVAYRRGVQGRPIRGRGARHLPTVGIGVARFRRRIGLDLDGGGPAQPSPTRRVAVAGLGQAFGARAAARRGLAIERRRTTLEADLAATPSSVSEHADLTPTMRVAWELVAALRASLLSLEERATRIVPAEVAGLIALWTQLGNFDSPRAIVVAWLAWGMLIAGILVLGTLIMPSRLDRFWDGLVPPEIVLSDLGPCAPEREAAIAAHMSTALHGQIDRLRRGFRFAVWIGCAALVLIAIAYVLEKA